MRRSRLFLTVCTAATAVAVQVAPAAADQGGRAGVRALSGASPFAGGCPGRRGEDIAITGAEVEPSVTVDRTDPRRVVATWQQDIGTPAARSDLVASSDDGGRTWRTSTIPGLTVCTGGTADQASDPWLSVGRDGTVYFSGISGIVGGAVPPIAVVASRSTDGGRTWAPPTTVTPANPGNDTDSITASPTRDGHAYLVWANWDHAFRLPMTANALRFSRTTDGGASWSLPVTIHRPATTAIDFSGHVLPLPGGALLAVWANADVIQGIGTLLASRSRDEGRTWGPAVVIAAHPVGVFSDPETGNELPQPGFPSAAVSPDGTVYVASEASTSPDAGGVSIFRSCNGGRTWTTSELPGVTAFAFEPAIAVDAHGTVGITWYDLRNDRRGDATLTTDVSFAHSRDRGATWRQEHLAGSFDLRTTPNNRLGEYQGLAGLRHGFAAVFTMSRPAAEDGPSDIFVAHVGS